MTNQISLSGASDVRPKLSALIKDMCPHGVEFKKLGEVCKTSMGEFVKKDKQNPNAPYPVYNGGSTNTGFYDEYNTGANKVIISARGAAGFVNKVEVPFWAGNSCHVIDVIDNKLNWRFLYYYLKNHEYELIANQQKGGGVPAVSKKQIEAVEIPIPPLEIQKKIVECLDKFSALAAELQAELQMRRKQYEYYRTHLLTPHSESNSADNSDDCNWEWKTLGEIFELRGGYTPSKNNPAFWEGGTIPWFRMEDIRLNGRILKESLLHVTPEAIKGKGLFEKDSFVLATSATIGEHALLTVDALTNQRFTNLKVRKQHKSSLHTKFIFYYMFKVDEFCKAHTNLSGFESVDMDALRKMPFPIPPLDEQKRIADLLDKFEALTMSLSDGIPAEQAAQQKRYEYYRDLLLTFPRKEV